MRRSVYDTIDLKKKVSLKEKLEVYKAKAAGVQNVGSPKEKVKEEVI